MRTRRPRHLLGRPIGVRRQGYFDEPERYTLAGGALAGSQADLLISARAVPHVWTIDDRLGATVAGDAHGEELKQMAESSSLRNESLYIRQSHAERDLAALGRLVMAGGVEPAPRARHGGGSASPPQGSGILGAWGPRMAGR